MRPSSNPSPGIYTLDLLSPSECTNVIQAAEANAWKAARVKNSKKNLVEVQSNVRSASSQTLNEQSDVGRLLHQRLNNVIRPIVYHRWHRDFPRHSPVEVVRYIPGGFYKAHTDSGRRSHSRYITMVCYLNDDFTGGGTYFPNADYRVKPEQGMAVLFPADYLHQADTVQEGMKYIAIAWLIDAAPMQWI